MTIIDSRTRTVLAVAGALALAGCGGADKPDGSRASIDAGAVQPNSSTATTASIRGNGVDRAFVTAMVSHDRSAMAMARVARRRGTSAFVKRLAGDVVRSQTKEISAMRREDKALEVAGIKRGSLGLSPHMTGSGADARTLKTARPFDPAFLRLMTVHYQGAIVIARVEIAGGRDPELRKLAATIINARKREVRAIGEQLGEPAGRPARPVPPIEKRDPRSGSPDMPGVDDQTGLPSQTE